MACSRHSVAEASLDEVTRSPVLVEAPRAPTTCNAHARYLASLLDVEVYQVGRSITKPAPEYLGLRYLQQANSARLSDKKRCIDQTAISDPLAATLNRQSPRSAFRHRVRNPITSGGGVGKDDDEAESQPACTSSMLPSSSPRPPRPILHASPRPPGGTPPPGPNRVNLNCLALWAPVPFRQLVPAPTCMSPNRYGQQMSQGEERGGVPLPEAAFFQQRLEPWP